MGYLTARGLVGKIAPVKLSRPAVSPFDPELYISEAFFNGGSEVATANNLNEAEYKAIMAAYANWAASNRPPNPLRLKNPGWHGIDYVDPRQFVPLTAAQLKEKSLQQFTGKRKIRWIIGTAYNGRPVMVPEDLIFQGVGRDNLYIVNNTSGLAAGDNADEVVKRATLSRIMHDAIMRTWLKRLNPYILAPEEFSSSVKQRVKFWVNKGRELVISQLDSRYGEVYLATITGRRFPCFCCGAAATFGETEVAIREAVNEAEARFGELAAYNETYVPAVSEVRTRLDHGLFYARDSNAEKLDFLFEREEPCKPFSHTDKKFSEIEEELDLIKVWLSPAKFVTKAVRVFSVNLVPLTYGIGFLHSGHVALEGSDPRIFMTSETLPHFYM